MEEKKTIGDADILDATREAFVEWGFAASREVGTLRVRQPADGAFAH